MERSAGGISGPWDELVRSRVVVAGSDPWVQSECGRVKDRPLDQYAVESMAHLLGMGAPLQNAENQMTSGAGQDLLL